MATYENWRYVAQINHEAFREIYNPGDHAQHGGIYRCLACGHEILAAGSSTLPSQSHARHPAEIPIKWQLLVAHEPHFEESELGLTSDR